MQINTPSYKISLRKAEMFRVVVTRLEVFAA
jgi:hypothetical protein